MEVIKASEQRENYEENQLIGKVQDQAQANDEDSNLLFSVILITHKVDQSSKVIRLNFDSSFIEAIKEKLSMT